MRSLEVVACWAAPAPTSQSCVGKHCSALVVLLKVRPGWQGLQIVSCEGQPPSEPIEQKDIP